MDDLIERLIQASGPGRQLDKAIAKTLGPDVLVVRWPTNDDGLYVFHQPGRPKHPLPHYTASLDAALQLVPEGLYWTVDQTCRAWIGEFDGTKAIKRNAKAATPALALCIAALKAREST